MLLIIVYGTSLILILYQPSIFELIYCYLIDFCTTFLFTWISDQVHKRFFTNTLLLWPKPRLEDFKLKNDQEKYQIIESALSFPIRNLFSFLGQNLLKVVPAGIIMIFFWHNPHNESYSFRLLKYLLLEANILFYFCINNYISVNKQISRHLRFLHMNLDLENIFDRIKLSKLKHHYVLKEKGFLALFSAVIALTLFLLLQWRYQDQSYFLLLFIMVLCCQMIMLLILYFNFRDFFHATLATLLQDFLVDKQKDYQSLPLQSSYHISRLCRSFNRLIERIRHQDQEIERWLLLETETSRYRELGEISAVIAHNISGPIHSIQFSATELLENSPPDPRPFYENLKKASESSLHFLESLKARVKNIEESESVSLKTAWDLALRNMKAQYPPEILGLIQFDFGPCKEDKLQISSANLLNVLYNLMKNSIDNMIENDSAEKRISLSCIGLLHDDLWISFKDTGSGLSAQAFEEMTNMENLPLLSGRKGLGLRLSRLIINKYGGDIKVNPAYQNGTELIINLPISKKSNKALSED